MRVRVRTIRILLKGFDAFWESQPAVAIIAIAVIIGIAALLMSGRAFKYVRNFKNFSEKQQMVVGAVGCTVLLLLVMLFAALWGAGSGSTWF